MVDIGARFDARLENRAERINIRQENVDQRGDILEAREDNGGGSSILDARQERIAKLAERLEGREERIERLRGRRAEEDTIV